MKKLIITAIVLCMVPVMAMAAPSLTCDPQTGQGVQWYVITGLPAPLDGSRVVPDATGTYGFKLDMAQVPVGGPYTVKVKACKADAVWGEVCSADSSPFQFSRPSGASGAPTGIKLAP